MRDVFSLSISLLIELLRERPWDVHGPIRCQQQHRRLNLFSSITVVPTLESPINLETFLICVFLSKDGERGIECRKVYFCHFLVEQFRQEVNTVFVGHGGRTASIAKHNARDNTSVTQQATGTWRQTQRDNVTKRRTRKKSTENIRAL